MNNINTKMLNLSKTIFGRMFAIDYQQHFVKNGLLYLFNNKEYRERFTIDNINGHLDMKLINDSVYNTKLILFSPNFELVEEIINRTNSSFKHTIQLYTGCTDYKIEKHIRFDDIPPEITKILDIKNSSHIKFCSCCGQNKN